MASGNQEERQQFLDIIMEFPDPQDYLIGLNLFFTIKEGKTEIKKQQKTQIGKIKQLAQNYLSFADSHH